MHKLRSHSPSGSDVSDTVSQCSEYGYSLLHAAVISRDLDYLGSLLLIGCELEQRDSNGFTALHVATLEKSTEAVRKLIRAGCDPTSLTWEGMSPLHIASEREGSHDIIVILGSCGRSCVDIRNKIGRTALHLAARLGSIDYLRILLDSGCDREIKDKFRLMAVDVARKYGHSKCVEFLLRYKPERTCIQVLRDINSNEKCFENGWDSLLDHQGNTGKHQHERNMHNSFDQSKTGFLANGNHGNGKRLLQRSVDRQYDVESYCGSTTTERRFHDELQPILRGQGANHIICESTDDGKKVGVEERSVEDSNCEPVISTVSERKLNDELNFRVRAMEDDLNSKSRVDEEHAWDEIAQSSLCCDSTVTDKITRTHLGNDLTNRFHEKNEHGSADNGMQTDECDLDNWESEDESFTDSFNIMNGSTNESETTTHTSENLEYSSPDDIELEVPLNSIEHVDGFEREYSSEVCYYNVVYDSRVTEDSCDDDLDIYNEHFTDNQTPYEYEMRMRNTFFANVEDVYNDSEESTHEKRDQGGQEQNEILRKESTCPAEQHDSIIVRQVLTEQEHQGVNDNPDNAKQRWTKIHSVHEELYQGDKEHRQVLLEQIDTQQEHQEVNDNSGSTNQQWKQRQPGHEELYQVCQEQNEKLREDDMCPVEQRDSEYEVEAMVLRPVLDAEPEHQEVNDVPGSTTERWTPRHPGHEQFYQSDEEQNEILRKYDMCSVEQLDSEYEKEEMVLRPVLAETVDEEPHEFKDMSGSTTERWTQRKPGHKELHQDGQKQNEILRADDMCHTELHDSEFEYLPNKWPKHEVCSVEHQDSEYEEGKKAQEIDEGEKEEETVHHHKEQETVDGDKEREIVDDDKEQETLDGDKEEETVDSDEEEIVDGDRGQGNVDDDKQQETVDGDKRLETVDVDKEQDIVHGDEEEETVDVDKKQEIVDGDEEETVDGDKEQETVDGDKEQETVDGDEDEETVDVDKEQEIVHGDEEEETVDGDKGQGTVDVDTQQGTVDGDTQQETVDGDIGQETVDVDKEQEIVDGDEEEETVDGDKEQETVDVDREQEIVDGDEKKETVDGDKEEETVDGDNQQETVVVDKEQEIVDGDKQQETVAVDKEQETVDGDKEQETVDGDEQQGTVDGDKEEETVDGNKEQGVDDDKEQETVHVDKEIQSVDGNNEQDTVDGDKEQEIVDVDNLQEFVDVEEEEETVDGEKEQDIVNVDKDKEIVDVDEEESVDGDKEEETVDGDKEQVTDDGEKEQEIVVVDEEEEIVNEDKEQETVDSDKEQETVDSDKEQETVDGDKEQETVFGNEEEETVQCDKEKEIVDVEEKEETVDGEKEQEAVYCDKEQETIDNDKERETVYGDKEQETVDGDEQEETVDGDKEEETVDGDKEEENVDGDMVEETVDSDKGQETVDGDKQQETVDGDKEQETVDCDVEEETVDVDEEQETVDGDEEQETVDANNEHKTVGGHKEEETVDGDEEEETVDGDKEEETVDVDKEQEIVCGDKEEETVDGDKEEETVDVDKEQEIVGGHKEEETVDGVKEQETVDGDEEPETVDEDKKRETVYGDEEQETVDGDEEQETVDGDKEHKTVYGDKEQETVDGDEEEETVHCDKEQEIVDVEEDDETVDDDKEPETVYGDRGQETVDGDKEQDIVDVYEEEETVDGDEEVHNNKGEEALDDVKEQGMVDVDKEPGTVDGDKEEVTVAGEKKQVIVDGKKEQETVVVDEEKETVDGEKEQEIVDGDEEEETVDGDKEEETVDVNKEQEIVYGDKGVQYDKGQEAIDDVKEQGIVDGDKSQDIVDEDNELVGSYNEGETSVRNKEEEAIDDVRNDKTVIEEFEQMQNNVGSKKYGKEMFPETIVQGKQLLEEVNGQPTADYQQPSMEENNSDRSLNLCTSSERTALEGDSGKAIIPFVDYFQTETTNTKDLHLGLTGRSDHYERALIEGDSGKSITPLVDSSQLQDTNPKDLHLELTGTSGICFRELLSRLLLSIRNSTSYEGSLSEPETRTKERRCYSLPPNVKLSNQKLQWTAEDFAELVTRVSVEFNVRPKVVLLLVDSAAELVFSREGLPPREVALALMDKSHLLEKTFKPRSLCNFLEVEDLRSFLAIFHYIAKRDHTPLAFSTAVLELLLRYPHGLGIIASQRFQFLVFIITKHFSLSYWDEDYVAKLFMEICASLEFSHSILYESTDCILGNAMTCKDLDNTVLCTCILVRIGLLKSEEKVESCVDLKGPLVALTHAFKQSYFSRALSGVFVAFLSKPNSNLDNHNDLLEDALKAAILKEILPMSSIEGADVVGKGFKRICDVFAHKQYWETSCQCFEALLVCAFEVLSCSCWELGESLLVYLGLMKSEDPVEPVREMSYALKLMLYAAKRGHFTGALKDMFSLFLKKPCVMLNSCKCTVAVTDVLVALNETS